MALRAPRKPTAGIDEAIGFAGSFGVVFLAVTVFCELTGRPALGWALTLLVCVLALVVLWRWRVAVVGRSTATAAPAGRVAAVRSASSVAPDVVAARGRAVAAPTSTSGAVDRDHAPGGAGVGKR